VDATKASTEAAETWSYAMRLTLEPESRYQDEWAARYGVVVTAQHRNLWHWCHVLTYVVDIVLGSAALAAIAGASGPWVPWLALAAVLVSTSSRAADFKGKEVQAQAAEDAFAKLMSERLDLDDASFQRRLDAVQNMPSGPMFRFMERSAYNRVCRETGQTEHCYKPGEAG